jgi:hypothetical protein
MAKLNKRQIIILAITGMAVLYGAYEIFFASPAEKKTQQAKVENTPMSKSLVTVLTNSPLDKMDGYIIARAETDWKQNPFWDRNLYRQWTTKSDTKVAQTAAKIIYSGYIEAGKKKMAIINGIEYSVGESLEIEGYVLRSIAPTKIKIVNRNTRNIIDVSLQE